MSRKSRKRKRRSKARSRRKPPSTRAALEYRRAIRQVDQFMSRNDVDIRPDNWRQVAPHWFAPEEPDRGEMARYIAAHEDRLGVAWAREIVRLEVFFQAEDYAAIIDHYDRALSRYPRCALVEMWMAEQIARHGGDWWRARPMLLYAADNLPAFALPRYELGFMDYLLGDFPSALDWFNQAAALVTAADAGLGSRIFFNRGLVRFMIDGDRKAAIADVKEALRYDRGYAPAKEALHGLRGEVRWAPW